MLDVETRRPFIDGRSKFLGARTELEGERGKNLEPVFCFSLEPSCQGKERFRKYFGGTRQEKK